GPVASLTNFLLPTALGYYVGYSSFPNTAYNPVTGSGATNGTSPGDYTLTVRYGEPGVTSLWSITAAAASGVPGSPNVASANTGQTITLRGNSITAAARVRFTTFNANSPQSGLSEREVIPTSIVPGVSLNV